MIFLNSQPHTTPSPACIWMQAGVVDNKKCYREFHCDDCRFDQAMTRVCRQNQAARKGSRHREKRIKKKSDRFIFWQDKLKQRSPAQRPCIHHMKGRIEFKLCPRSYRCIDCEFDQFFQDRFKVYAKMESVDFNDVKGFSLPAGYYLGHGHIWVKLEGSGLVSMGIDDFASRLLGQFDSLIAPLMGKALTRGQAAFTLSRGKNRVTFSAPISGVVTQINPLIQKQPDTIARAPYTDGWILTLHCPDLKNELRDLMFMETAVSFMEKSAGHLYGFIEERTGLKAADGGELVPDIYGNLPQVTWEELVDRFLK